MTMMMMMMMGNNQGMMSAGTGSLVLEKTNTIFFRRLSVANVFVPQRSSKLLMASKLLPSANHIHKSYANM